ncbi:S1 family peptidase [Streptomyces sp. F63]|uniref:S1 family peptidase n=1 Tax=Streptomyces sp. F63 TaxID=2824887 RepID=UPI002494466A|nr:S1 family peptidase [Streptomyces sp. F63]
MKVSSLRTWSRITWPAVAALAAAFTLTGPASAGAPGQADPKLGNQQKAAAAQLAKDYGVSAQEAQRRIQRQDRLTDLATDVRKALGSRFGGAWIDHDNGGRLTVAVTQRATTSKVHATASKAGARETRTVVVRHSLRELTQMSDVLARRIAKANKGAANGLQAAVVTEDNALRLDVPRGKKLTADQHKVVKWAKQRFGGSLRVDTYAHASEPLYCGGQYSCDPPLRSGVAIYGSNIRCTSAFSVYDSYAYYMLTAGHCAEGSSYWQIPTYSYGYQGVGSAVDYTFGYYGDSAIVRVDDAGFWQPRGWVYPSTSIRDWGYDYVGQYVCKQGSTTGYTCGQVTDTHATVSYPNRTLTGMTWSTACVAAGDSGSGVYYGSTAYGILSGGPSSGCGMIHEPVSRALSQLGVTLLSG